MTLQGSLTLSSHITERAHAQNTNSESIDSISISIQFKAQWAYGLKTDQKSLEKEHKYSSFQVGCPKIATRIRACAPFW